jgi:chemotaxis protein MotB
MDGNDLPPIIVKKKAHGGGHHGGAWKVAYADFVTAMMALFIVLWILSSSEKVKQAVSGYFKDPIGFESGGNKSPLPGKGAGVMDMGSGTPSEEVAHATETKRLEEIGKQIEGEIKNEIKDEETFKAVISNIKFEPTNEGLRIEMIEEGNNIFFDLGSAQLNSKAIAILHIISKQLVKLPNKIAVEGHTDSRPFSSAKMPGITNWELSEERANAARRELVNVKGGISDAQLDGIVGYADKRLRDPKNPYSLVNRRISIIVRYSTK